MKPESGARWRIQIDEQIGNKAVANVHPNVQVFDDQAVVDLDRIGNRNGSPRLSTKSDSGRGTGLIA